MNRDLTDLERDVAWCIAMGMTNQTAARMLGVSVEAVRTSLANVFGKLNVSGRDELAALAFDGRAVLSPHRLSHRMSS